MLLKHILYCRQALLLLLLITLPVISNAQSQNNASNAAKVFAGLSEATWITEGKGKHIVYIFFDPNCPSCKSLYGYLRSFVKSNQYQFRWLPVAIVNTTSLGKAAAMLEAPNPLAAFRKNKIEYRSFSGGLDEAIASAQTEQKLKANEQLLNGLDIAVIPSMLFADKSKNIILIQGALSPLALRKVFARLP